MNRHSNHRRFRWVASMAVVALALAACAGSAALAPGRDAKPVDGSTAYGAMTAAPAAPPAPAEGGNGATGGGSTSGGYVPGAVPAAASDLLVIKTGSLSLEVKAIDPALSAASAKITALGGFISASQRSGDADQATASVTYSIPVARWDEALVALRALADKVLAEQTQSQEVTGQVIDLGARSTNLQATEAALQAIMVKATKISDVLAVQDQLTQVRGQIEELTAQKTHLEGQAAYSTLSVTYGLKAVAAVSVAQKGFDPGAEVDRAVASLIEIGQGVSSAAIYFGIVWLPVLLVVGVLAFIARKVWRRIPRRPRADGGPMWGSGPGTDGGPGTATALETATVLEGTSVPPAR